MLPHDPHHGAEKAQKDPVLTLQLGSREDGSLGPGNSGSVSSLCFVSSRRRTEEPSVSRDNSEDEDSASSDSDDEILPLRTRTLVQHEPFQNISAREMAPSASLSGRYLASCQINGDCFLWDLGRRTRVQSFTRNRGPGLLLRRTDDQDANSRILYQTRDDEGTVSLHDMNVVEADSVKTLISLETHSTSFCAAAPCRHNPNLVALPSRESRAAVVHDWRTSNNGIVVHGEGNNKHGMLASLALSQDGATGAGVLACGMESGSVFLYDLRMTREPRFPVEVLDTPLCSIDLSRPILSLDMVNSETSNSNSYFGVVAVAGIAGNVAELSDLAPQDRGTVAVLKSTCDRNNLRTVRLRSRLQTCELKEPSISGKPGVSICRFRPDGRIFAIGGWDYRLRVFDRAKGSAALAITKGHTASVHALDWSSDAERSGLLATGGADGQVNVWRLFPQLTE